MSVTPTNAFLLLIFGCFFSCICMASSSEPTMVIRHGRTPISINLKNEKSLRLEIITTPAIPPDSRDENAYLQAIGTLFGREDIPDNVISGIRAEWSGVIPSMISASAYVDLYAPGTATLIQKQGYVVLRITGGDGSAGYEADIEMTPLGVIRRRVKHRTSGYSETTNYQHSQRRKDAIDAQLKNN